MPIKTYPETTSVRELQRNYRKILEFVQERREPVFLLRHNKIEAVILDPSTFELLVEKARGLSENDVLEIVRAGRREHRLGKTKKIASLADLEV